MLEFPGKTKCLGPEKLRDHLRHRWDLKSVALVILLLLIVVLLSPRKTFSELDAKKRGVRLPLPATPSSVFGGKKPPHPLSKFWPSNRLVDLSTQPGLSDSPCANISDCAYQLLNQRSMANRAVFLSTKMPILP
jgi:hypothetical protein